MGRLPLSFLSNVHPSVHPAKLGREPQNGQSTGGARQEEVREFSLGWACTGVYGAVGFRGYGLSKVPLHQERSGPGAGTERETLTLTLSYREWNQGDLFNPEEGKH